MFRAMAQGTSFLGPLMSDSRELSGGSYAKANKQGMQVTHPAMIPYRWAIRVMQGNPKAGWCSSGWVDESQLQRRLVADEG